MLSRVRVRVASCHGANLLARCTTTARADKPVPIPPTPPTLSSKQLEELNELAVALAQRGHTCVNTRTSTSALTWCGKHAQQCSGLERASINFPKSQKPDDVSVFLMALAIAPWAGILLGSIIIH